MQGLSPPLLPNPMTVSSAPAPRGRENDWQLLKRLVPYAKASGSQLGLSLFLLVPVSIAGALQPIIIGQAISLIRGEPVLAFIRSFLGDRPLAASLHFMTLALLGTVLVRLAFRGWQGYLVQQVGQEVTAAIRDDLFDHVTALSVRFFDRTPVGKLITRLTSDVEALGDVFSTGAIGIVSDLFSLLVVTGSMLALQWQLGLILVAMLVPVTALIVYFQHEYRKANYKAREDLSELNSALQENIMGISVVQLFRRERYNSELFRVTNQRYIKEIDRTIFHDSAVSATLEWVALLAVAAVLWFGSPLVLDQTLTVGALTSFILFSQRLFDPLRQLAEKFTSIQAGLTAVERIADLLNEPIEVRDRAIVPGTATASASATAIAPATGAAATTAASPTIPLRGADIRGEIQFDHVSFGYKADDLVLKDLNFTIRPGEKVALVGPTGAGKSSIIRLLCRLYDPIAGRILIDGIDIRDLPQQELRRRLGVILQDGFIFAGDVQSNIALGESYPFEAIQEAAQKTNIDGFIDGLPQGYATQLRQRGANLSGGQKQLLAFARVAIRDPGILVLDEATSNLDVGTEAQIQQALEELLVDRTAIVIAHRLSTIRNVDRILVLKQGQLVESGSHDDLLELDGLYASLYKLQMLGVDL